MNQVQSRILPVFNRYQNIDQTPLFSLALTAAFLVVGGIGAIYHEMWRDEIQAWLLARDSTGPIDLLSHMKYEGHPPLWHLLLMPLTWITHAPEGMQAVHLLIAATTVFLFARYSPFTPLQKILFSFGYFVLYEYGIVCRNYGIGLLLICIFCILFRNRYQRIIPISISLFLTSHTSVHALIIVICIAIGLGFEYIFNRKQLVDSGDTIERQIWVGFGIMGVGILTAVLQLNPPPDTGFAVGWKTNFDLNHLKNVIKITTRAYFPIPATQMHFWGSRWIEQVPAIQNWNLQISVAIFIWAIVSLLRKPTALLIYISATLGLLAFFYTKYFGGIRHHGFLFIAFLMAVWISCDCDQIVFSKPLNSLCRWWEKSLPPILTLILMVHTFGGIRAVRLDQEHVFSHGRQTAQYIIERSMNFMPIIGDMDYAVSTVVGYLEYPKQIYYMRGNRPGSFVRWDNKRVNGVSDEQVIQKAKDLQKDQVLIILNRGLPEPLIKQNGIEKITHFTGSTISNEGFHLYLLETSP